MFLPSQFVSDLARPELLRKKSPNQHATMNSDTLTTVKMMNVNTSLTGNSTLQRKKSNSKSHPEESGDGQELDSPEMEQCRTQTSTQDGSTTAKLTLLIDLPMEDNSLLSIQLIDKISMMSVERSMMIIRFVFYLCRVC